MGAVQIVTASLAAAITLVAVVLAIRAVRQMAAVVRLGQPVPSDRFANKRTRTRTMLRETLGHRMLKWSVVGHWFVISIIFLSVLVASALLHRRPAPGPAVGGEWTVYGLVRGPVWSGFVAIVTLIGIRLSNLPRRHPDRARRLPAWRTT